MRAGAGYVTAAIPRSLNLVFESRLLEVMTLPLPDADGDLEPAGFEPGAAAADAVEPIVGPGLGRTDGASDLARAVAHDVDVALVLDADGLNAHAGRLDELAARTAPAVLTPHAGELGRLLEIATDAVPARRLHRPRTPQGRGLDRRPQGGRHAGRDARRSVGVSPGATPGAGDRGHRRRLVGSRRRAARSRPGAVRRRVRGSVGCMPRRVASRRPSSASTA